MLRTISMLPLLFIFFTASAQDTSLQKYAPVNVSVTDMKGKPSKGEQVFFRNNVTGQIFSGYANAAGKFSLQLPAGADYFITIKSLTDTAKYGKINIPALEPDEYYTEPFNVDVKYKLARLYTLKNVYFDFGKASLRPESFPELEDLVSFMKNKDDVKIEIAGHTDNVGKDADNLRLSSQRADAIRNYLIKKSISPARVTAKGYGATQPIAGNDTEEGRQLNRRTEVRIL